MPTLFNPNKKRGVFMIPSGATKSPTPAPPSFTNTYSLAFDGTDDYISLDEVVYSSTFSFSFWIKPSSVSTKAILGDISNNSNFVRLDSTTSIKFKCAGGAVTFTESSGNDLVLDSWQHIMVIRDSSNNVTAFRNGTAFGSSSSRSGNFTLNSIGVAYQAGGWFFNGNIDEVALWTTDQTANIGSIYSASGAVNLTSLNPTAWYRNGDNGSYKSPQWLIPNNSNVANSRISNYSLQLDGVDDYIDTGAVDLGETNTISFWFKNNSANTGNAIIGDANDNVVYFQSSNLFYYPTGSITGRKLFSSTNIASAMADTTNWHNLILIRKAPTNGTNGYNDLVCYLDGNLEGTFADVYTANINLIPVYIGKSGTGFPLYDGLIDEVSYYNNDQSANVASIYNSAVPTTITGSVAHWKMGEDATFSTNWTVPDAVGSNNGTSANMTIEDRTGDASGSNSNSLSYNMTESDRVEDTPS